MQEPATIINNNSKAKGAGTPQISEEKNKWSFEYLQRLNKGPFTTQMWDHFRQWSLSQIPEDQRNILSKEEIDNLGKAFINYPLRIYRIAQDMGFKSNGKGNDRRDIWNICLKIGKNLSRTRGETPHKLIKKYRNAALCRIKQSGAKEVKLSVINNLAKELMNTDWFAEGLEMAAKRNPSKLREYVMTRDMPSKRFSNYPLHFLLFAFYKFLHQTGYTNRRLSKYKLISGFLLEQGIGIGPDKDHGISDEVVKKYLQRQHKDANFLRGLKDFYERCQAAYWWPFVNSDEKDIYTMTRELVDNPCIVSPHLSILFPNWEEIF
jgi:hypothetical protein